MIVRRVEANEANKSSVVKRQLKGHGEASNNRLFVIQVTHDPGLILRVCSFSG
jgi:hypothetical protein